ncbi:50S ribosomal protein L11 methyltransferase [Alkalimarinus alittae]|uniref:50S ribosomal protein L11 methyltransferase n=1 Tax=Alkalimarinus alittae TaxID=2961619 RepID=A0ABY6N0V0_9ALTE|nr:50S ribosomal protein L11 methyltransferase [Alkalimarinus alittae]UZE95694.1 50S ribosomal protein L11 methyltransferase [Alkalimarinus alittae]
MTKDKLIKNIQKTLSKGDVAITQPAGCKALSLYLFNPEVLEGPLSHDEAQAVVAEPAYWSFCWASGQALASYILQHPELVAGKNVLDFGAGSAIVAIAAAKAGANKAIACDIDPDALDAANANASLNNVEVVVSEDLEQCLGDIDVIVAADVLYDPENMPFLKRFKQAASLIILADSRVKNLGDEAYELQQVITCRTWPDLNEFEEFNQVRIYHAAGER